MIFSYNLGNEKIPALIVFTVCTGHSRRSRSSSKQRDAASPAQVLAYTKPGCICCDLAGNASTHLSEHSLTHPSVARRSRRNDGHGRDVLRKSSFLHIHHALTHRKGRVSSLALANSALKPRHICVRRAGTQPHGKVRTWFLASAHRTEYALPQCSATCRARYHEEAALFPSAARLSPSPSELHNLCALMAARRSTVLVRLGQPAHLYRSRCRNDLAYTCALWVASLGRLRCEPRFATHRDHLLMRPSSPRIFVRMRGSQFG